jgi:hypothetical protein
MQELERVSPDAPLLALGQTVFWDEPMKGGVAHAIRRKGFHRRLVSGVHDTDYFAKVHLGPRQPGKFKTLPHNDASTKGLWSAAGEFSALFGSETVVTRDALQTAGLRIGRLESLRPGFLDEATEAWGWRGIVSLDEHAPISMDVPARQILGELKSALSWATDLTLQSIDGQARAEAEGIATDMRAALCDAADESGTLTDTYRKLIPYLYELVAGHPVELETTATSQLLRLNQETAESPRFDLPKLFFNPATRSQAKAAYDEAIRNAKGLYELAKFGTGAIPFDLVVPGKGRGTIRLGTRGAVIMTPEPLFLSFKTGPVDFNQFVAAVEAKFGTGCVLVGKAVTLIGMLAREFVFLFHEGASSYVAYSRALHNLLAEKLRWTASLHPILRVGYNSWDALGVTCTWLKLPQPLQRPFGAEEICSPSFAHRWREVAADQEALLAKLGELRRPIELIRFLQERVGGSWQVLAEDYEGLHTRMAKLEEQLAAIRTERSALYKRRRQLRRDRVAAEVELGSHFRAVIFEKDPTAEDLAERNRLQQAVEAYILARDQVESEMHVLRRRQNDLVRDPEVLAVHEHRRRIETEAELKRLRLVQQATMASAGLRRAGLRPSAWWFPMLSPDGLWLRETVNTARYWLEPLR